MSALPPLAQSATEWVGPSAQIGASGVLLWVLSWFMRTVAPQLKAIEKTMEDHTRSLERSLDLNTRATLLLGIAHEETTMSLKAKLKITLDELEKREEHRKAK
jgi:hypothetical protein